MIQLDLGRSNNGLPAIVRLWRHRNNGLWRVCRISLLRQPSLCSTRIERLQVFLRGVVNHIRAVKHRPRRHASSLRPDAPTRPIASQSPPRVPPQIPQTGPRAAGKPRTHRPKKSPAGTQLAAVLPAAALPDRADCEKMSYARDLLVIRKVGIATGFRRRFSSDSISLKRCFMPWIASHKRPSL